MNFNVRDGEGAHAIDLNQLISRISGRGVISGGLVTEASGDYAVNVEATSVYLNGERVDVSETDLDLSTYVDENDPRKALIYIDSEADIIVAPGEPEEPRPQDEYRWNTYRPAPPDFSNTDGVVLAEVWLEPEDFRLTDADIRNRRLDASYTVYNLNAETVDANEYIDGSGTSHTGELTGDTVINDEDDVMAAINNDPYHGRDAQHDYFSGSHDDLTDVRPNQHHQRYTDEDARDAVRGQLDATDLTGETASEGQFIEYTGDGLAWTNPPQQQATVLDSGTFTHGGGSSTTALLEGITSEETAQVEMAFGVADTPDWEGDYGYSAYISRQWDESATDLDVEVTVSWDDDPGSGNNLEIAWTAYDTAPVVVEGRYTDADAVQAIDGSSISPDSVSVSERLRGPVYDDVTDIEDMEIGDVVVASGNGSSPFGLYLYDEDDGEWVGPLGTSVSALSELSIDTDKNWNGFTIQGLPAPQNPNEPVRQQELTDHSADTDAHHEKTTSTEIDHAQVSNVQPDQHHSRYSDDEAVEAATGRAFTSPLTGARIPPGEYLQTFHRIPSGETLSLVRAEVIDEDGNAPSGLSIQLYNMDTGSVEYSSSSLIDSGSLSSPLETVGGGTSVAVRIYNGTGSEIAASGSMSFEIS